MKVASIRTRVSVGGFILLIVALLTAFVFSSRKDSLFWTKRNTYYMNLNDASGLQVGAPVRIAGLTVGEITSMELTILDGKESVRVGISVQGPYDQMLYEKSQASLQTQGVLGDKFIALSVGDPTSPRLQPEQIIQANEQVSMASVMQRASEAIDNLASVSTKLKNFTEDIDRGPTLSKLSGELTQTSRSLRSILDNLNQQDGLFTYLTSNSAKREVATSIERMAAFTQSASEIAGKLNRGEGTLGLLLNDTSLHKGAQEVLGQSNRREILSNALESAHLISTSPTFVGK